MLIAHKKILIKSEMVEIVKNLKKELEIEISLIRHFINITFVFKIYIQTLE